MQEHYNLTDENYNTLINSGVTIKHFFSAIPLFDPNCTGVGIGLTGLYYYIDKKGDFNSPPIFPHKKIAQMLWKQLVIKDKIAVAEYIDDMERGEF